MQSKPSDLRAELKQQIDRETVFKPWMMILVTIVLPIIEAILVNQWTSTQTKETPGICLVVVALLHLLIGSLLIWNEFQAKSPLRVLAEAADLADTNCSTQRELDRRVQTYKMFRDAIEEMNAQVCTIQSNGQPFDPALRQIIKRFLDSFCETIDVCSNRYTLEVYLRTNVLVDPTPYPELGDFVLAFFDSPTLQPQEAIGMGANHPLKICDATNKERLVGRVSANPELFFNAGSLTQSYFEQYAIHIIPTQCRSGNLGYVAFTTTQTDAIASDALETLGLIALVISSFHSRWYDCEFARALENNNDRLKKEILSLQPGKPA